MIFLLYSNYKENLIDDEIFTNVQEINFHDLSNIYSCISKIIKNRSSDYILFWDFSLGPLPSKDTLDSLITRKVDAWHGNQLFGYNDIPDSIYYTESVWIYNISTKKQIESTSYKTSLCSLLIKTKTLKNVGNIDLKFRSHIFSGIDIGYRLIKSGALIRYTPLLSTEHSNNYRLTDKQIISNEFTFLAKYYSYKWIIWYFIMVFFKQGNYLFKIKCLLDSRKTKKIDIYPSINDSTTKLTINKSDSVSILVPTLNRHKYLINQINELDNQILKPMEILITDQSNDELRKNFILPQINNVDIKYFPQNKRGQVVAWNKLINESKGKYILFMGDDNSDINDDFISSLVSNLNYYDADIVASHVNEVGTKNKFYKGKITTTDTFPVTLVKKQLIMEVGMMDMNFNQDIRADKDLLIRCYLYGAHMIYDYNATITHLKAPMGGLREFNKRKITNYASKRSVFKLQLPTVSEILILLRYYPKVVQKEYARQKIVSSILVKGSKIKSLIKFLFIIFISPYLFYVMFSRLKSAKLLLLEYDD